MGVKCVSVECDQPRRWIHFKTYLIRLICRQSIQNRVFCVTFITFCRLLSQAVIHSRQPVALNWARNSFGLVLTVFLRKICILGIAEYFLIVLFQISEIKKDEIRFKKNIFLLDMFLIVGGEGSSNRNASRDESVEARDKSVEAGDESIEAGEKTPQSCYNGWFIIATPVVEYIYSPFFIAFMLFFY